MNIIESIKEFFRKQKIKRLSKKTEKLMINETEDEKVAEKLYELANAEEDSVKSQIFEHVDKVKVTQNMDNPAILLDEDLAEEIKAEHIDEDSEEQISLDGILEETFKEASETQVRELANSIPSDADKQKVLDNGIVSPMDKPYFIDTFNGNIRTLKNCIKNIDTYPDTMVAKTLENLLPESDPRHHEELENLKVKIVILKTVQDLLTYGIALHMPMLTEKLDEESKLVIAEECFKELQLIEDGKKEVKINKKPNSPSKFSKILPASKVKLVADLYECTKLPKEEKDKKLEDIFPYLTEKEIEDFYNVIEQNERQKMEKENSNNRYRSKGEGRD